MTSLGNSSYFGRNFFPSGEKCQKSFSRNNFCFYPENLGELVVETHEYSRDFLMPVYRILGVVRYCWTEKQCTLPPASSANNSLWIKNTGLTRENRVWSKGNLVDNQKSKTCL